MFTRPETQRTTFFCPSVGTHSHKMKMNTHSCQISDARWEKSSSPFKWLVCFYVLPFLKQCPFPLCLGEMTKKDNIVNSRCCTCKTHSQCVCLCVCLFALFLYLRACVCSIFISSPCMSLSVKHISSFKCRLSGKIKFKFSKTHRFDALTHTLTDTHKCHLSISTLVNTALFYTGVWGAIGQVF